MNNDRPNTADGASGNPYLFVVGCQRSGTTLLQRMLDSHPLVAVGYDSHFIPRPIKRLAVGVDPPLTPALVEEIRHFPRFARLGLPASAVDAAAAQARTYGAFVTGIYDAFGRLHGKPLAGEKSPGYCRHLPHLHALFPWAKTIHLVRDGRDVALSMLDWGKGPSKLDLFKDEPIGVAAMWWDRDVTTGRADGTRLATSVGPGRYHEVCYERLVAEPEPMLRGIADFLGLPFAEEMVTYHQGKTRTDGGRSAKAAWLPPTKGLRDWRTQMPERDVELFEALAGDALSMFGYERAFPEISPAVRDVADRCREWWRATMSGRRDPGEAGAKPRAAAAPTVVTPARTSTPRSPNPFVFIVGCPRSGTTLLKRIVDAHPEIAITPETHWVPRFYRKRVGVGDDGRITDAFARELLAYPKFKNLRIDEGELETLISSCRPATYEAVASAIYDAFGRKHDKRLVGDKTPGYVQHIGLLHTLWPDAKFVHLIRDGRDVCLSVRDWDRAARIVGRYGTWDEDPVTTAAYWWERFTRLGREAGAELGPDLYHEVRYESLVDEPATVCADLCSFLGLPYDEAMVRFHEGRTRENPTLSAKKSWKSITPGLRSWQSEMPAEDVARFEAASGELLSEIGYERACPHPEVTDLERAARMRDRFTHDPHFKDRTRPRAWAALPGRAVT